MKEMKRQKLDLEQTIETLKKSLYEEAIASAQQNGMDEIMPSRLYLLLRRSRRRRCCMINFVALRKNCRMNIKLC